MAFNEILLETQLKALGEIQETLVVNVSKGGSKKADANMELVKEMNESIISRFSTSADALFKELENQDPKISRQVSVNQIKLERIARSVRAVEEREEKKAEYMRKLKSLRKQVPIKIREQLKLS